MSTDERGHNEPTVDVGVGARRPEGVTGQLWRYRQLLTDLARIDFAMRFQGALFGFVWAVGLPLLQAVALVVVFSRIHGLVSEGDFPLYVVSGVVWWSYFSQSLGAGGVAIVQGGQYVDKVWFPRVLLPVVPPLANLLNLGITTAFVVALATLRDGFPGSRLLLLVPLVLLLFAFTSIIAALVALVHAWYRDVAYAMSAVLIIGFYLTPVIYEAERLGDVGRVLRWSPVAGIIGLGRAAVDPERPIGGPGLIVAVVMVVVGWRVVDWAYRRFDHNVADML